MLRFIKRFYEDEKGQTMTEYILITVLIAIALIAVWKFFGQKLFKLIRGSAEELEKIDPSKAAGSDSEYPFGK